MSEHIATIDVDAPISTVYNQWTQFEDFPRFMDGVEEVKQLSDTMTHWKIKVGGVEREFDAEITEQVPEERIAWRSVEGPKHAGLVTFHKLADDKTRVTLQMDVDPEDFVEKVGEAVGIVERRIKGDLQRFKEFIESRRVETGAWRGEVPRQ
jgi:uncharacterized membrane protein